MSSAAVPQSARSSSASRGGVWITASDWFFALLVAGAVVVLYGSSLHFGLIWDDPNWYRQASQSTWQVFAGLSTYQFYRPLAVLTDRLFVSPAGVVNAPLAHAVQVSVHLAAAVLCLPVLRALQFKPWHARLSALIFAIYPLSFQAVAWQVPQQPFALLLVLVALWSAQRFIQARRLVWLAFSGAAYAAALLFQENALPFMFLFFWLAYQKRPERHAWPLLHGSIALAYGAVRVVVPHLGGITGVGFQPLALSYLLQAVVFVPAHLVAPWLLGWPLLGLTGLYLLFGGLLVVGAWQSQGRGPVVLCCVWIAAGLLPPWAGLSWTYVEYSPRLAYLAAPGIAGLWGAGAAMAFVGKRPWTRLAGWATLLLVVGVSWHVWYQFETLYQSATSQLAQAVQALSHNPEGRILFVNFPDTINIRPAPFPLGVWGVLIAPVVQNLSDYALANNGASASDLSLAAVRVGAADRHGWAYDVALRGQESDPATLLAQARWVDWVYLSDYTAGGTLRLRGVGRVLSQFSSAPAQARLGNAVALGGAGLSAENGLSLVWRVLQPLRADDTIFVHYWQAGQFVAGQDGDSLGGLIPPAAWQPGMEVVDVRPVLSAPQLASGRYEVRVGLYNRTDGTRYPAYSLGGEHYPDDEVPVGTLVVP